MYGYEWIKVCVYMTVGSCIQMSGCINAIAHVRTQFSEDSCPLKLCGFQ